MYLTVSDPWWVFRKYWLTEKCINALIWWIRIPKIEETTETCSNSCLVSEKEIQSHMCYLHIVWRFRDLFIGKFTTKIWCCFFCLLLFSWTGPLIFLFLVFTHIGCGFRIFEEKPQMDGWIKSNDLKKNFLTLCNTKYPIDKFFCFLFSCFNLMEL